MDSLPLGKHNPRLAEIRLALRDDSLTKDGLLVVEGPKLIEEARESGLAIVELFVRQGVSAGEHFKETKVFEVDKATFQRIQSTETSQGLVALVRMREFELEGLIRQAQGRPIVVLARLQDPGNVGTIVRLAESFEAAGCVAFKGTASAYNSKAVRASAGSIFRLPQVWDVPEETAIAALREAGISILGSSPNGAVDIREWDWERPAAVLVGNEGSGLNENEVKHCDVMLHIPHSQRVESLNSAAAAALILYERYRDRGGK